MARKQTHVVYGYKPGQPLNTEPAVMGFGISDQKALADAKTKTETDMMRFYFVRSNGDKVPAF